MFLLDIKYDYNNNQIIKWIKDNGYCKPIKEIYYPKIYVTGLDIPILLSLPGVKDAYVDEKFLLNGKKEDVICLNVEGNQIYNIASIIENKDNCKLYNIDIDAVRKYLLEKNLFPMAKLKNYNEIEDDQFSLDYEIPDIKIVNLIIKEENKKGIRTFDDKIGSITIRDVRKDIILEGKESDIINNLNSLICEIDPDMILTTSGDSFEIAYLLHRAIYNNINLQLGREKDILEQLKLSFGNRERSYFSYGRIIYKPRMHLLSGRLHIDKSQFLFREGGLSGLIDISRITGIPMQECSRLSPGSAITALQINHALRENMIIPWKRYNAENWKTAEDLLKADRGSLVLEPKVGIHENIYELDYVSLFPNIMVNNNISPETVLCKCCLDSRKRVPFIGYNICEKSTGIVPKVLKPLIERRMEYKKRKKELNKKYKLLSDDYENKQNILKWLLVTSFGYMGFNKAIFGKIECHESITAYARDILLRTIELADDMEFEIIHGIVDCLWVKPLGSKEPEELCKIASKDIGINLELKSKFNWIVFLPNKTNSAGSANRYYGLMENGELKIRGIEIRRSDSPQIIKNLQKDILTKFAEAKNISEFYLKIPDSIDILKNYVNRIYSKDVNLEDLIFQINVSREYDHYIKFSNHLAALRQLKKEGIDMKPGQNVRYVITDSRTKDYNKRVILPEFIDDNTKYDAAKYYQYLLKATESILLPFGYTEDRLNDIIDRKIQMKLYEYT